MSILKQAKSNMASFRPAVSDPNSEDQNQSMVTESDENPKKTIIDEMAQTIIDNGKVHKKKKNPLDRVSRTIPVAVSPRIEAQWRFLSSQQGRSMSDFIKRAVDYYIQKHGL